MTTASPRTGTIGIDESGKGDYFGPLVIAGVCVTPDQAARLRDLGVRDSKTCSDKRAHTLAAHIRTRCPTTLVTIGPERYNSLYASLKNLNTLLAWGHARAIENLLETVRCERVIADQFGNAGFLNNALMQKGRTVNLIQKPRAEQEIEVAAASLVARAAFLRRLQDLSARFALPLPKGAGPQVITAGKAIVEQYGPDGLGQVAKLHFRTTQKVLA